MINNSFRALAASLVLAVPGLALAKAPAATAAPAKSSVGTPVKANVPMKAQPKSVTPVVSKTKSDASAPVKASEPAAKGSANGEHKKGASHDKSSTKKDAAKAGKSDGKVSNDAKH